MIRYVHCQLMVQSQLMVHLRKCQVNAAGNCKPRRAVDMHNIMTRSQRTNKDGVLDFGASTVVKQPRGAAAWPFACSPKQLCRPSAARGGKLSVLILIHMVLRCCLVMAANAKNKVILYQNEAIVITAIQLLFQYGPGKIYIIVWDALDDEWQTLI